MSNIHEIIKSRRSVRQYTSDPVPEKALKMLFEAMRWAPSAGNAQPVRIHVVRNQGLRADIAAAALHQNFIAEAPLAFVIAVDLPEAHRAYGDRGIQLYCLQDAAAATQNLLLAASAQGLGTCWVGAFDERAVAGILSLPREQRPVAIVSIGKPAEIVSPPMRKSLEEIVFEHP
ncbi:MAG: nitroreductase family protein [Proteobacteria bacterium]|nr:nitroreductase family protein [Pseudomonadota bacterium]